MRQPSYVFCLSGDLIIAHSYEEFHTTLGIKLNTKLIAIKKAARLLQSFEEYVDFSLYKTIKYELTLCLESILQDDLYARMFFGIGGYKSYDVLFGKLVDEFCAEMFCIGDRTERFLN